MSRETSGSARRLMNRSDPRPLIDVACGVLQAADGRVLLAQRPAGKLAAGKWEFPGGKIEPGESAREALLRELREELDIGVATARPLLRLRHAYRDRIVRLDAWLVSAFDGEPCGREGQRLVWTPLEALAGYELLPTVVPIAAALALPTQYVITPPDVDPARLRARLAELPRSALLRLRLPLLDDRGYSRLASGLREEAARRGIGLVGDRAPEAAVSLRLAGWHASAAASARLRARPLPPSMLFLGSAHSRQELLRLTDLGADAAVLGPVKPTATHPDAAALGWPGFEAQSAWTSLPVYAIGGLSPTDLDDAHRHGAQGIAAISSYWS